MRDLSESKVQTSLFWKYRSSSSLLVPNYTPFNWWECDLWRLKPSGFTEEFEIKLSVSDFRADFKKSNSCWKSKTTEFKHLLMASGSERAPNQFSYVMPVELFEKVCEEVPDYAGVIVADVRGHHINLLSKQKPRKLHAKKADVENKIKDLSLTFYHRYWNLRNK